MDATQLAELNRALGALLDFRLADWHGLGPCQPVDVTALFGAPVVAADVTLGAYQALREDRALPDRAGGGLVTFARGGLVIAVETAVAPPMGALQLLGDPAVRLEGEFNRPGYMVREWLYPAIGLAVTVAEPLGVAGAQPAVVLRCRGVRPLAAPHEYGAEYRIARSSRLVFDRQELC